MSDLGQQLKEARLQKGLSLDDVQEMTKIRKRYLEAIEAGDYKVLPGSFYVRAFIKTYAETVGVDADGLLEEHRKDVPVTEPEPTMEPVIQKRRSSHAANERNSKWLSTTLMWSFAAIIVIVIYIVISSNYSSKDNKTPDPTPVTTNTKTPNTATPPKTETTTPPAQGGNQNTGQGQTGTNNQGQTGANQGQNNSGTGTGDGTNGSQTGTGTDTTGTGAVTVTPDGKKGSTTVFKVANTGNTPVKVEIKASGKSWMDIRKGTSRGEKLYYKSIEDGEVQTFDLGPEGLYIKSGNSNNTVITVGGQVVTDGKNTTRIQLKLDNGTGDQGSGDGSTQTSNSTTDGSTTDGSTNSTNNGTGGTGTGSGTESGTNTQ
ncbi:helix-turn-helix domain-containing protein [Paenibacillus tuaregi]|uniref:helix-turn-helix domain-containing protein n=1 Tax=Paenibacillus tuaregi TaxID=1816681 RepID=UPI0008393922|nr:RodZ domain-containing protein [Paenibacillus tuaregi]